MSDTGQRPVSWPIDGGTGKTQPCKTWQQTDEMLEAALSDEKHETAEWRGALALAETEVEKLRSENRGLRNWISRVYNLFHEVMTSKLGRYDSGHHLEGCPAISYSAQGCQCAVGKLFDLMHQVADNKLAPVAALMPPEAQGSCQTPHHRGAASGEGERTMRLPRIGECYHNKFSGKQCQVRIVYLLSKKTGDITDGWTWCLKHLRVLKQKQPQGGAGEGA